MLNFKSFTGSKEEGGPMDVSYWLSFSPMAPLFGVKYRYAEMFKFDPTFAPKKVEPKPAAKAPAKKAKPAAKAPVKKAEAPKVETAEPVKVEPVKVEPIEKPKLKAEKPAIVEVKVEEAPAPVEAPAVTDRPATLFDAPPAKVDDLKLIKGVGPKLEGMLNGLGIYTFEQIAGFSQAELQWVDDNLTSFKGRAFRDDWIAQAKDLMA